MSNPVYLHKPIAVPSSRFVIIALGDGDTPYAMDRKGFTGSEAYDLSQAFSLMPYLTRMAEIGEEVPDYDVVMKAVKAAKDRLKEVTGERK